ncbi:uncharacterized protein LY79DRAFT_584268 [Colletotrichum navitas]|uniref:PD-(D/E)XK nuclease-like domain-containing protein n=1 Tax=Colletotrichum navitas TaxID=681940 RepID=A0AAD8PMP8_9PEZI|nr:uncharacterized protein LY79DRAFT_584268 [Colletotrichum navitas]KAK1570087.1 hypothetical protein LY79DRAFT_584268 [Colletotrichum navitas]
MRNLWLLQASDFALNEPSMARKRFLPSRSMSGALTPYVEAVVLASSRRWDMGRGSLGEQASLGLCNVIEPADGVVLRVGRWAGGELPLTVLYLLVGKGDTASSYRSAYAKDGSGNKRSRRSSPQKQTMLMVMENAIEAMSFRGLVNPPLSLHTFASLVEDLAKIHLDYSRGVDFYIFFKNDNLHLALVALQSPFKPINQTNYPALFARPIAFSIETRISGDRWAEAVT